MLTRRGFFGGLLAAPAIIRPGLLMPVKPVVGLLVRPVYFNSWQAMWLPGIMEVCYTGAHSDGDVMDRLQALEAKVLEAMAQATA